MTADASPTPERLALTTADTLRLRAEWTDRLPSSPTDRPTVVLCHPHPLHGGNMHASVIDALFRALPTAGSPTLRFNFRGVQGSDGRHDQGNRERFDVLAAIDEAYDRRPGVPVRLIGWSFGADLALAVPHPAVDGWIAIAPPLRTIPPTEMPAATDQRPTHLIIGEHDAFRPPAEARDLTASWQNTTITELDGADHFFGASLPELVDLVLGQLPAH